METDERAVCATHAKLGAINPLYAVSQMIRIVVFSITESSGIELEQVGSDPTRENELA